MDTTGIRLRDLTTLDDFRRVVALEKEVWSLVDAEEAVPASMLAATVRRGAILIGAFDPDDRLVGMVYSVPGFKGRRPIHWSHMLGVRPSCGNAGIGRALKIEQRRRALGMGLDLIEWTYDPLQALNAHLNFSALGVIVEEYEENAYGEMTSSPLWAGIATDRFIAEWQIASVRVDQRITHGAGPSGPAGDEPRAEPVNAIRMVAGRPEPTPPVLGLSAAWLEVVIPLGFGDMQLEDPELARAWRLTTREIFTNSFRRGYRAVDFRLDRAGARGTYLLTRREETA
jgi:predicted GNAT superfamily acetyltransferase